MDLKILQWNIRSTKPKPSIELANSIISPNIICLQETWFTPTSSKKLTGYTIAAEKSRVGKTGGGVAIYTTKNIKSTPITLNTTLEACAIKIHTPTQNFAIMSIYLPSDTKNEEITKELDKILASINMPYLICMDANAKHPVWGAQITDNRGSKITDILIEQDAHLLNVGHPTYLSPKGKYRI